MFGMGATELIVVLVVALLIFGPGKLPEIGGALGRGIRDFRKALEHKGGEEESETAAADKPPSDKPDA
jgi:sec-independent protein translocase protein TatA